MKAVLCTHFGPPEALKIEDIATPRPDPGEALVRVKAVALNFFDTLLIAGKYQHKPPFPFSPGAEFAGIIESVGTDVGEVAPGDRVVGYSGQPVQVCPGYVAAPPPGYAGAPLPGNVAPRRKPPAKQQQVQSKEDGKQQVQPKQDSKQQVEPKDQE